MTIVRGLSVVSLAALVVAGEVSRTTAQPVGAAQPSSNQVKEVSDDSRATDRPDRAGGADDGGSGPRI